MRVAMTGSMTAVLLLVANLPAAASAACMVRSGAQTVPLVELYTSEGCSSCPPADRWLSAHAADTSANWLAFHVDYWDDIGWPDRFAAATYSQRQRARVGAAGGTTVYTPQVMVGAQVRAPWRSGPGMRTALREARIPAPTGLALRLQPEANGWQVALGASRSAAATFAAQVWLAQYSDDQNTAVRAGENAGVNLHHDRVVRRLWGPWPLAGATLSRHVAVTAPSPRWGVIAFVQDARGRILQSLSLPADACVADQ